jgi:hypothetical protein
MHQNLQQRQRFVGKFLGLLFAFVLVLQVVFAASPSSQLLQYEESTLASEYDAWSADDDPSGDSPVFLGATIPSELGRLGLQPRATAVSIPDSPAAKPIPAFLFAHAFLI